LSANKDILTVSIHFCIFLSSFLIAMAKNSITILNGCENSGHPRLLPHFRGNGFSFSALSMILTIGVSYIAYTILRCIISVPGFLRAFIIKWCWIWFQTFSASNEMISGFCLCFY
jgi:hypothetical protein